MYIYSCICFNFLAPLPPPVAAASLYLLSLSLF